MTPLGTDAVIGPYRLLFPLGRGGMGEVWAVRYTAAERFVKIVALKLIRAPHLDSQSVVMFFDEARAMLSLSHSAIVPTIDFGVDDGYAHIAMELVRGPSLSTVLRALAPLEQPLASAIVASIGIRVSTALDYAHRRAEFDGKLLRLVHRDVSPQNILLGTDGHVRLSDFGIARTTIQAHATAMGMMRGKSGYMSPEQIAGEPLDDRSDMFALATVLYECATARRLFLGSSYDATLRATLTRSVPPLTEAAPGFPSALAEVIASGLEKYPDDRPASVGEFGRLLSSAASELPDFTTAERDTARLLEEVFEPGAFDLDERIRDVQRTSPGKELASLTTTSTWPVGLPFEDTEPSLASDTVEAVPRPFTNDPAATSSALHAPTRGVWAIVTTAVLSAGLGAIGHAVWSSPDTAPVRRAEPMPAKVVERTPPIVEPHTTVGTQPPAATTETRQKRRAVKTRADVPRAPESKTAAPDPTTRAKAAIGRLRRHESKLAVEFESALIEALASGEPSRVEAVAKRAESAARRVVPDADAVE